MTSRIYGLRNKSPPRNTPSEPDLRTRLEQEVTLDTDLEAFLIITGLKRWTRALHEKGNEDLLEKAQDRCRTRRETLSYRKREREGRLANRLHDVYLEGKYKTIREFKAAIESTGYFPRQMGYITLATFNEELALYGLGPIRMPRGSADFLKKYGLEPLKPHSN